MRYLLYNQNQPFMDVEVQNQQITKIHELLNIDYAPIQLTSLSATQPTALLAATNDWLFSRSIPVQRKHLHQLLKNMRARSTKELLFKAHGMSLSDQYWLKEKESEVKWQEMNFFENDFPYVNTLNTVFHPRTSNMFLYPHSPISTTEGLLPKCWIIEDELRLLVKGIVLPSRQEPLNEWLATQIAQRLGFEHCAYSLMIYDNQILSKCANALTKDQEFIPADQLFQAYPPANQMDAFNHYIQLLEANGLTQARIELENMLILDYLLMNYDRHLRNFGIIRNVQTLKWEKIMPLFDHGHAMNADRIDSQMDFNDRKVKFFMDEAFPLAKFPKLISQPSRINLETLADLPQRHQEMLAYVAKYGYVTSERAKLLVNGLICRITSLKQSWS